MLRQTRGLERAAAANLTTARLLFKDPTAARRTAGTSHSSCTLAPAAEPSRGRASGGIPAHDHG